MYNLIGLLVLYFASDSIPPPEYYRYKDSLTTEIIHINNKGYYECYRTSTLRHTFPFYCQGTYKNDSNSYILHPGIVDSLVLTVREQKVKTNSDEYFCETKIKMTGKGTNLFQLIYFNYDHLNKLDYDSDIRLCAEDINGTKHYKRLDRDKWDFHEIVTEKPPVVFYILVGQYTLTRKYFVRNHESNYFIMSINRNELFNSFKDFYLANHRLTKTSGQLKDLMTNRVYSSFIPVSSTGKINDIARE